jgi:CubicO group peptidase (beta-lactamase class C family)
MFGKRIFVTALLVLCALAVFPQDANRGAKPDPRIVAALEPIRIKHQVPALAGAIVTGKGLAAIGAVGVRKAGTEVAATVNDQWHLGSDTKAMTATLIAALVERGKLKWETSLEEAFPDLAPGFEPELRRVTLLHLLSHRAGLPANLAWFALAKPDFPLPAQRLEAVKMLAKVKLLSTPGSSYLYSNWGYVIAGALAEKTMSRSWEDLIREFVFSPLGVTSAGFGGPGTPGQIDEPWGHGTDGKPVAANGPAVDNPAVIGPAGTVHMTLGEWAKFAADHIRGALGEKALLKPETYAMLHTPPFGGNYALGWLVAERDWGGGTVLTHAGSNTMNYAVIWLAPKLDFAVLACTNQGGPAAAKACDEASGALVKLHASK